MVYGALTLILDGYTAADLIVEATQSAVTDVVTPGTRKQPAKTRSSLARLARRGHVRPFDLLPAHGAGDVYKLSNSIGGETTVADSNFYFGGTANQSDHMRKKCG